MKQSNYEERSVREGFRNVSTLETVKLAGSRFEKRDFDSEPALGIGR